MKLSEVSPCIVSSMRQSAASWPISYLACSSYGDPLDALVKPGWGPPLALALHPYKVSLWLRHFQRIGMDAARITIEGHLAQLGRARELAFAHGQISAGVQAEHYRGKAVGLYDQALRLDDAISDI